MSWKPVRKALANRRGRYGPEYRYRCPRCHQDNLWWVPSRGGGKCYNCHVLYGDGNLDIKKMRALFRDFSEEDELRVLIEELNSIRPVRMLPPPELPDEEEDGQLHWKVRWYCGKERKCSLDSVAKAGVYYDAVTDRVHFPLAPVLLRPGCDGPLCTMSRTPSTTVKDWRFGPKEGLKERHWFNPVGLDPGPLTIVEGPFDVLASGLLGKAVALCGTQLYEDCHYWFLQHRASVASVYLWMDPDAAGKAAAKKIQKQLAGLVTVRVIDYEREPGDCTPEEVAEVLRCAS